MANVLISEETLTRIADAIRSVTKTSELMKMADVPAKISELGKTSDYGKDWTLSNKFPSTVWTAHNANGLWVLGSYNNGLYYSIDGIGWAQSNVRNGRVEKIYNADGLWVAAIDTWLYYSTDGKSWMECNIMNPEMGITFECLCYGDGVWLAGSRGSLYRSTDGKEFTRVVESGCHSRICYANGIFVAGVSEAGIYYSTNGGLNWTVGQTVGSGIYIHSIKYFKGKYYACTDIGLFNSTDGKSWSRLNGLNGVVYSICYGKGIFVAGTSNKGLYYSTNGTSWTQSNVTSSTSFESIGYADGIFIAGDVIDGLYYSTDGKEWENCYEITSREHIYVTDNADGMWLAGIGMNLYYSKSK